MRSRNKVLLGIILSIILILSVTTGLAVDYKYTQESGAGFFVADPDKADAWEDTNEIRQIIDDLGNLLVHSKRNDLYPKDGTTGGTLAIPNSALVSFATGTKGDLFYCSAANTWIKLNIGSDNQILVVTTDLPNWETPSSDLLSDVASIAMLDENEEITGAWTITGSIGGVDTTEFGYLADISAFGGSIIDDADEATFKATVNLEIGTDVLAYQVIGIADDNLVEMDDLDAAVDDYCKLTANGIVGRSYSEVKTDLGIDLSLYYLKTEIDTLSEVETIYTKDIIDSDELAALKFTDLNDTPANYTGQAGKHLKVNVGETALEYGTNTDTEIADAVTKKHSQNTDTDLDATFEATFVKKADTVNVLSDITSTGANIEDAVTKRHTQNTDTQFDFYNALGSDHLYSGDKDTQLVGESVVFGDLLYFDWTDKEWKKTDADAAGTMPGLRIALETKSDGQTCLMLVKGYIRDDSAFEFAGAMVYGSVTPGAMSSTAPVDAGDQVQRVGVAKSADILFFDPSIDVGEI